MRREIKERICDTCGQVKQEVNEMPPDTKIIFTGWYRLKKLGDNINPWDFCCLECVGKFAKGEVPPPF